jgi:hypothetical protein
MPDKKKPNDDRPGRPHPDHDLPKPSEGDERPTHPITDPPREPPPRPTPLED